MTYYDEFSDDIDDFDFAAEAKRKREKSKKNSVPKSVPKQQVLPDKSVIPPPKVVSNSAQKLQDELIQQVQERKIENEPQICINCITVGNVDAGKSTIFGHLVHLLSNETRSLEKLEKLSDQLNKPSFKYAYFLDTNQQERERGVTIAVNSYSMQIEDKLFVMQDCPGHQDFSDQIQKSVAEPDVGILALEAGQFQRLQKKIEEQLRMLVAFNVLKVIVVVNKMDTIGFDQQQFNAIRRSLIKLFQQVQKTFGSNIQLEIIPCAAMDEIDNNLVESSQKMLFAEATLKQSLINCKPRPKSLEKPPVISILDFSSSEGKLYFTANVLEGFIQQKDVFYIQNSLLAFQVTQIQDFQLNNLQNAVGFCRLQVQIFDKPIQGLMSSFSVDLLQKVKSGSQAALAGQFLLQTQLKMANRLRAQLVACEQLYPGQNFDAYVFNQKIDCRIRKIDAILENDKLMEGVKDFASENDVVVVDLVCDEKVVVKEGYRVVLRGQMNTVAVGVLKAWN
uniref:Elongation factor Tu GTP binding domain-containing protein n=1 Tax=Trepomonas sp. PC1 TaxID=1076344 RepID=A0A146KAB2_9EUKA|eukprot:JAP93763.1 Elongation factor Tu GTP binding domain-containing protein [Trepomonas sp. PC1]